MSWGISENATSKEKLWADINDTLKGFNSVGKIDYTVYSEMYDELRKILDLHINENSQLHSKIDSLINKNIPEQNEPTREEGSGGEKFLSELPQEAHDGLISAIEDVKKGRYLEVSSDLHSHK